LVLGNFLKISKPESPIFKLLPTRSAALHYLILERGGGLIPLLVSLL
jgi:hypothetical protein